MVLTTLLEAFGIQKARDYVRNSLVPYLRRLDVDVLLGDEPSLSNCASQVAELDKYLEAPAESSLSNSVT